MHSDNGTNELKLAVMPTIVTNKKTVQYSNLKTIEDICKSSCIESVRYIQFLCPTPNSNAPLTNSFARMAYSSPSSYPSFIDTVLYLIPDLPYQCGHKKSYNHGVAKHSWMVLRKVCLKQDSSIRSV